MAKKYLLYIHHPAFAVEKNKSKLVNQLLLNHYAGEKIVEPIELDKPEKLNKLCDHGKEKDMCMFYACPFNPNQP